MARFTLVEEIYDPQHCNHRLRFGSPDHVIRLSKRKRLSAFSAGKCFGYIRWSRNVYGTQNWQFIIAQARGTGRLTPYPGLYPGADIWFRARGKTATKRALEWIDKVEIETRMPIENLPESFWRRSENAQVLSQKLPIPGDVFSEFTRLSHV